MTKTKAEESVSSFEARKSTEKEFSIPTDLRTQEILFRLREENSPSGKIALKVWKAIEPNLSEWQKDNPPAEFVLSTESVKGVMPEDWNALQYEIEEARILYGEKTPRVQEFVESRRQLNRSLLVLKERMQWEQLKVEQELMSERDKEKSPLFQELNAVAQDIAQAYGFNRPVTLEITRSKEFNAFVLQVAKEGGVEAETQVPLRFFVHAGLVDSTKEMLSAEGKPLTRDHLAFVVAHELGHLTQPGFHLDKPPADAEEHQRYEYDADGKALEMMDRAGYNPHAGIEWLNALTKHKDSGQWKEIVGHYASGTHPISENRVKELWQAFNRPDRPFFSAQKEFEPLSAEALAEADLLLRKEFNKRLEGAQTLHDWNQIIAETLEQNERATINDAAYVGKALRTHTDVRGALAAAIEEIETSTGLSEALVAVANYVYRHLREEGGEPKMVKEFFKNIGTCDIDRSRSGWFGGGRQVSQEEIFQDRLLGSVLANESREELRKELIPEQVDKKDEERVVEFVYQHRVGGEFVPHTYFQNTGDLFNPSNLDAVSLWRAWLLAKTPRHLEEERKQVRELKAPEVIARAKQESIRQFARFILFGIENEASYQGKALEAKNEFLAAFEALKQESGVTEKSGALPDYGVLFNKVAEKLANRVSGYREIGRPPELKLPEKKKEKEEETKTFSVNASPMMHPARVPEEALSLGYKVPESATALQRVLMRYYQGSRGVFERALYKDKLREEFGFAVHDNPRAKDLLFHQLFYQSFFSSLPTEQHHLERVNADELRSMPELFEYSRVTYHLAFIFSAGYVNDLPRFFVGDMKGITRDEDIAACLERLRILAHHPSLQRAWASNKSNEVGEAINNVNNPFETKIMLFKKYAEFGLGAGISSKKEPISSEAALSRAAPSVRRALTSRAKTRQLPATFFERRKRLFQPSPLDKLRMALGNIPEGERKLQRQRMELILSEEFTRLMADDAQELELCNPDIIQFSDTYRV